MAFMQEIELKLEQPHQQTFSESIRYVQANYNNESKSYKVNSAHDKSLCQYFNDVTIIILFLLDVKLKIQ